MSELVESPGAAINEPAGEALGTGLQCEWKAGSRAEASGIQLQGDKSGGLRGIACPVLPIVRPASHVRSDTGDASVSLKGTKRGNTGNVSIPALESAASRKGSEKLAHDSDVKKPFVPPRISPNGIPMERYRQKLEECASLHSQLQELVSAHCVTQEQLCGVQAECNRFRNEIMRLRDLLATATSELGIQQQHVVDLERENIRLREELRERQVEGMSGQRRMNYLLSNAVGQQQGGNGVAASSRYSLHQSSLSPSQTDSSASMRRVGRFGTGNVSDAVELYVKECFRANLLPHMELVHSLYDGGRLAAVDPPITHAQLKALQRVLIGVKWEADGENYQNERRRLNGKCQRLQDVNTSHISWFDKLETLTFRSECWRACLGVIVEIVRSLRCCRSVELFGISDARSMQQVTETLMMTQHVEALSLPEVALDDEGLKTLFTFIARRDRQEVSDVQRDSPDFETRTSEESRPMATAGEYALNDIAMEHGRSTATESGSTQTFETARGGSSCFGVRCLDLVRCTITDPTDVFGVFRCPLLEVLVLPASNKLSDINLRDILRACPQLHTLDISGNTALSTSCVKYIGRHSNIKVLRLENCPGIECLDLPHIEVLFSTLSHVTALHAPQLQRLPVPVTHSRVLFDFFAPKLREITLKGMVVDRGTLNTFKKTEEDNMIDPKLGLSVLSCERSAYSDGQRQYSAAITQFFCVGFIDCTFTEESEIREFVRRQRELLRFSLHGCRGVVDAHLMRLTSTILDLDVTDAARLTNKSLEAIVTSTPNLIRLNLKNAGPLITNDGIRFLHGLVNLEVLNLLRLPQILPEVVAGVAVGLPWLRKLYHETAVVGPRSVAAASAAPVHLDVLREDEEDATRQAVGECAKELLQLRNETALALWMEAQLPKPTSLLPSRTQPTNDVNLNIPTPHLTANTTFYEAAFCKLTGSGNGSAFGRQKYLSTPRNPNISSGQNEESDNVNVLVISSGGESPINSSTLNGVDAVDMDCMDAEEKSLSTAPDQYMAMETVLDEKSRLVIEKKPLGPWDEEDLVEKHRKIPGNGLR